jgi:hypothetical protein
VNLILIVGFIAQPVPWERQQSGFLNFTQWRTGSNKASLAFTIIIPVGFL